MSKSSDESRTVVLSGVGPNIKISNKGNSAVTVLSKAKSKTVKLNNKTNIKFST